MRRGGGRESYEEGWRLESRLTLVAPRAAGYESKQSEVRERRDLGGGRGGGRKREKERTPPQYIRRHQAFTLAGPRRRAGAERA